LTISGVRAPVRIVRDKWGVPHIYAASQADLFFAQGFVQAQDRLFQIDLWRRAALGRLAEVLGATFIERDAMTRRIQYRRGMDEEWASYGSDTRAIAQSFVSGINAWIDLLATHPPEEFALAGWKPEHWKPEDLLNRTDGFLASGNAAEEVFRSRLAATLGVRNSDALTRAVFARPFGTARSIDPSTITYIVGDALKRVGTRPFFSGLSAPLLPQADKRSGASRSTAEGALAERPRQIGGSNAWAIEGRQSTTGAPLLAADPHQPLAHPSLRYLVHLNAPGWNVIGAAAPWLPGVVIGHNDRIAWAMASRSSDVQDLYVERFNPENVHQVELAGRWVDTTIAADPIVFKGKDKPFAFERESTTHGPIVAADRERRLVFTLQWIGFEPGTAAELASLAIDRSESAESFRASLDRWKVPSATFVFATRDGEIGAEKAGWVPIRAGWDGAVPAPGWTGRNEWRGIRRESSSSGSPTPSGSHVIAANDNVPRTRRIDQVLSSSSSFDVDAFKRLQHDTTAWTATRLVPLLASLHSDRAEVDDARRRLLAWDHRVDRESAEAALYVLWERNLLRRLVKTRVDSSIADEFSAYAAAILVPALTEPSAAWFSGHPSATRDELLLAALSDAFEALQPRASAPRPIWGSLHAAVFRHPLGISTAARQRFNIGPFARDGYADTVMSTGGTDLEQTVGATFGMIVDLGNWDRSIAINAPGQSESAASPHFADLAKLWARGEYFSLPFTEGGVQEHAESTLVLMPR
jgi:penicillin amidase